MKEKHTSSQLINQLIGNSQKYSSLLNEESKQLELLFSERGLKSLFSRMEMQTISICPMALCDLFLKDIGFECPDLLLKGLGLTMFHISTHDDIVDEAPMKKKQIADFIYSGNIAYGYGINLLLRNGYINEVIRLIEVINTNHLYQTQIISKLWQKPITQKTYIDAIITTRSWACIGLDIAIIHSKRNDLRKFIETFSNYYGNICQIYDDIREIKQDLENKYYSLPISFAKKNNLDLRKKEHIDLSINKSKKLADIYIERAKDLTVNEYPRLFELVNRINKLGLNLNYSDLFSIQ